MFAQASLFAVEVAVFRLLESWGSSRISQVSEDEVTPLLTGQVGIAAVNGPDAVVVSGAEAAVEEVIAGFQAARRRVGRLRGTDATRAVYEEIDQLDATLSTISPDGGELVKLTTRLETLLHKWNDTHRNSAPAGLADDYGSATDDELFKILDAELGS